MQEATSKPNSAVPSGTMLVMERLVIDGHSPPTVGLVACSESLIRQPSLSFQTEKLCVVLFSKDFRTTAPQVIPSPRCTHVVGKKKQEQSP